MLEKLSGLGPLGRQAGEPGDLEAGGSRRPVGRRFRSSPSPRRMSPDSALGAGAAILEEYGEGQRHLLDCGRASGQVEPIGRLDHARRVQRVARPRTRNRLPHLPRRLRDIAGLAPISTVMPEYLKQVGFLRLHRICLPTTLPGRCTGELRAAYRTCRAGGEDINRGAVRPDDVKGRRDTPAGGWRARADGWIDDVAERPGWLMFSLTTLRAATNYGLHTDTFDHWSATPPKRDAASCPSTAP